MIETAAVATSGRHPIQAGRRILSGIGAVGVKELRGRMRGRRAFVVLTLYLLLLSGFAWMYELILAAQVIVEGGGSAAFASARIGQELFAGLLMLITLLVVFLAPSFTAGAISLEREKQTLDMLVTTPITSLAIVVGKLFSALTYVFILIAGSIPVTAVVFVFGGVAPDDVIRGYIVLIATAIGLGTFGLFCSAIVRRTQAATVITVFGVLTMTLGTVFVLYFWNVIAGLQVGGQQGLGPIKGRAPEPIAYLNPFLSQADIICGTQTSFGQWCERYSRIMGGLNGNGIIFTGDGSPPPVQVPPAPDLLIEGKAGFDGVVAQRGPIVGINDVAPQPEPFGVQRDGLWTKSVASWLVLSLIFVFLSVQAVSPTRRWRLRGVLRGMRNPRRTAQ